MMKNKPISFVFFEGNLEIKMAKEGGSNQLWVFVPQDLWETFQLMQDSKNPLIEALFYKEVYDNYFWVVSGFTSIHSLKRSVENSMKTLRECANHLNKVAHNTGIAGAVGGGAAIAGSVMGTFGLFLAPATAGISLFLTLGGAAVGAAGGVTCLAGSIINTVLEKDAVKKYQKDFSSVRNGVLRYLKN